MTGENCHHLLRIINEIRRKHHYVKEIDGHEANLKKKSNDQLIRLSSRSQVIKAGSLSAKIS